VTDKRHIFLTSKLDGQGQLNSNSESNNYQLKFKMGENFNIMFE